MRAFINAAVVNNVFNGRNDRANVVGTALIRSQYSPSTRVYATRAVELTGRKSVLLAGIKPAALPAVMPSSELSSESQASHGQWCSERHFGSLAFTRS